MLRRWITSRTTIYRSDQQFIEIENRLDYSNAFVKYAELTEQQVSEFESWMESLKR